MNIDEQRLNDTTEAYASDYEKYQDYAAFLRSVLEWACQRYAPGSFVEARVKAKASFAEKVVRKQEKFRANPNYDLTDRCGARVVVPGTEEAGAICSFIEKNFLIDVANSLDHGTHLKKSEFGYRSIHYVVQIREPATSKDRVIEPPAVCGGLPIPISVPHGRRGFKAEIQVRTMAEHVLASGLHDRLYKTPITVPEALERENARLAATLESVDARYTALASGIDTYLGHYSAYLKKAGIADELLVLQEARKREGDPERQTRLALRVAGLYRATSDWPKVVDELEPVQVSGTAASAEVLVELGHALCRREEKHPDSSEFERGQRMLEKVADRKIGTFEPETALERKLRALAAHYLGWSLSLEKYKEAEASARFRQAWQLERSNPYHLACYLEYEIHTTGSRAFVEVMDTVLREAIAACRRHVEVGIELPRAHLTRGRLHLLLEETQEALESMGAGIAQLLEPDAPIPAACLRDELEFLDRINPHGSPPPEHQLIRKMLVVALAAAGDTKRLRRVIDKEWEEKIAKAESKIRPELEEEWRNQARRIEVFKGRSGESVLIVSGGAKGMPVAALSAYQTILGHALAHAAGTVVSGGTNAGVPGLVGISATAAAPKGMRRFVLCGYHAGRHSHGVSPDKENYDCLASSHEDHSSQLEPLTAWAELMLAGVQPPNVQLLCINGGPISTFEMRFALALGARIGVVRGSGRAADAILEDPLWKDHPRLVPLPVDGIDSATMRAFVRNSRFEMPPADLDRLAELVHAHYLKSTPYADTDYSPERRRWKELREDLKESNRQQLLYAAEILKTKAFRLIKHDGPIAEILEPQFTLEQIDPMAELEHGRWCIERLTARWSHGAPKDVMRKISPSLIPYANLDDKTKEYDRAAIRNYAAIFKEGGYAVIPGPAEAESSSS